MNKLRRNPNVPHLFRRRCPMFNFVCIVPPCLGGRRYVRAVPGQYFEQDRRHS
jgi:hypothetical protein